MNLLILKTADGTTRTCNATCYNAEHPKCHCICGGLNHGLGEAAARNQTALLSIEELKQRQANSLRPQTIEIIKRLYTLDLFP